MIEWDFFTLILLTKHFEKDDFFPLKIESILLRESLILTTKLYIECFDLGENLSNSGMHDTEGLGSYLKFSFFILSLTYYLFSTPDNDLRMTKDTISKEVSSLEFLDDFP